MKRIFQAHEVSRLGHGIDRAPIVEGDSPEAVLEGAREIWTQAYPNLALPEFQVRELEWGVEGEWHVTRWRVVR